MKKIIVTVGPATLREGLLRELDTPNNIYRVNGAHVNVQEAEDYITTIRGELPHAEIMLDLPGNKIRTANLAKPLRLTLGATFRLATTEINYPEFYRHLKSGDVILASDSTLKFTVLEADEDEITFVSHSEGYLENGRGLHGRGVHDTIPFLFPRDRNLIEVCNRMAVTYLGLSFVRKAEDIKSTLGLITPGIRVVSKVETAAAVENLNEILDLVDYILVDRGDLSTDIGLEKVPSFQQFIIRKAGLHNKHVFLSTQFLKNMEEKPVPTIAEVIDLYNTFTLGIYGIQLSEETSIGKYPRECLEVVHRVLKELDAERK